MSDYIGDDELRERIITTTALTEERNQLAAWCETAQERIDALRDARDQLRKNDDSELRAAYWQALENVLALGRLPDGR